MQTIKALIILIIIAAAILLGYAYSGLYNIAVGTGHNPATLWLLETFRERSIEVRAEKLSVPDDLDNEARIQTGAGHYKEMCADCHGFPGQPPEDRWEPVPPALYKNAAPPAKAFWVIRHGIKMTAMPKHPKDSDEDIWNTVAFLQKLPNLSPEEYQAIMMDAVHTHANGDDHGHHGRGHSEPAMEDGASHSSHGESAADEGHNDADTHHHE